MPKAGMTMEEGVIVRWLKEVGDTITVGEPILEIETDKVSMEVEAEQGGVLLSKLYDAGDTVAVVQPIGYIGERGEAPPERATTPHPAQNAADSTDAQNATAADTVRATPVARKIATEHNIDIGAIQGSGARGRVHRTDVERVVQSSQQKEHADSKNTKQHTPTDTSNNRDGQNKIRITPLAKRRARELGIPIAHITASGQAGEILARDVARAGATHAPAHKNRENWQDTIQPARTEPLGKIRRVIAQNVSGTHAEVPPVTLTYPVRMNAVQALRAEVNGFLEHHSSLNSWICYAAVRALYHVPHINCTYDATKEQITFHDNVNIGIAVDSPQGLFIPVIHSANQMSLLDFDYASRSLIRKTQEQKIQIDDLQGATFSITNLGMYGVTHFTPIIPLPQVAILGIGAIHDVLSRDAKTDQVTTAREMNLLLTVDHRVVDGALAARYLKALGSILEAPSQLLL